MSVNGINAPDPDDPLAIAEYTPGGQTALVDAERWPTLSPEGARRLETLRSHPDAPAWVHATGDRLSAEAVRRVRRPLPTAGWIDEHLDTARRLPAYRRRAAELRSLQDFPLITRDDLVDDVSAFVPLDADLARAVHGSSSGSTGRALLIPDDIEDTARTFHLMIALAAEQGVVWEPDHTRLALAHVVKQRQAFTYASVISSFDQATMARLNLDRRGWRSPDARTRFLVDQNPQAFSGSPTSLAELLDAELVAALRPLAIFSGAMALSSALRHDLERAYGCPVIDIYGLHETRPIASRADDGPFVVLDRRVHVEIVDERGRPAPPGAHGEIVVTAGENSLLPLVRYRTGDFGRLVDVGGRLAIADLEGREATTFLAADGSRVPCVDLTQHLQAAGAHGWSVIQDATGRVEATIVRGDSAQVTAALEALLGRTVEVQQRPSLSDLGDGKPRRYVSRA
ncbi:AMP-binding protein [Agreia sp. PsM10]|uniref:AMP-binding protein n=1 Tax=Agreia sp. PsM10 TaxID=3030533 RepID=UPI00263BBF6B|nr:AMP-binding protein [Agreia sp. PsM10]MDN4639353.1 AMP-binding protein [Agreia sp. PsM10]